jgi:predicted alpha/beta superfamily hydrolase
MATIEIASVDGPYDVTTATFGDDPTEAIVVTDANLLFGMAVDLVRLMRIPALVPPVVVVGVGYPTDDLDEILRRRTTDFTPTEVSGWPGSGGSARFRTMLREHVLPFVASVAPTVRALTLFGHSLGGMFSVTDWMAEDRLFDLYVISSPSLWWDDHALLRKRVPVPQAPAYLAIGSEETDAGRRREAAALPAGDPWKPPAMYLDMVDDLLRFVACLTPTDDRSAPPVDIIDGEFHATVPPLVFTRGLRRLLRGQGTPSR